MANEKMSTREIFAEQVGKLRAQVGELFGLKGLRCAVDRLNIKARSEDPDWVWMNLGDDLKV